MNKFNTFLENHGMKVVLALLLLTYMKSCGINSEVTKLKKEVKAHQEIVNTIEKLPTKIDIQIEALKAEKRMIKATDRKMLDVQRQNAIEKEISELQELNK